MVSGGSVWNRSPESCDEPPLTLFVCVCDRVCMWSGHHLLKVITAGPQQIHSGSLVMPEEVRYVALNKFLSTNIFFQHIHLSSDAFMRCFFLSLSLSRVGWSVTGDSGNSSQFVELRRAGGMLTIIILGSTSLNKAKRPSHLIHRATTWASEAGMCVCVCDGVNRLRVHVCGRCWKTDEERNAFFFFNYPFYTKQNYLKISYFLYVVILVLNPPTIK